MGISSCVIEVLLVLLFIENLVFNCTGTDSGVSCIKGEREALLHFKHSLTDHTNRLSSWVGEDCCAWKGVSCSNTTGHVIKLELHNPFSWDFDSDTLIERCSASCFGGQISHFLLNLTHLKHLDLSRNNFSSTQTPGFLGSLKSLEYLDLSFNEFLTVDSLHWASNLSSLKHLNLSWLDLTKVEDWVYSMNMLPSLVELQLPYCQLPKIPPFLYVNLTSLAILVIDHNNFHSTIPHWLFNISTIQYLNLGSNNFWGSIPREMGNSKLLEVLDLSSNNLEGEIPEALGNLCNLRELYLDWNKFSGEISGPFRIPSGCIHGSLRNLGLSSNNFSGSLPEELGELKQLQILDLSGNSFRGPIPTLIGKLSCLRELLLKSNLLNGSIPKGLGQLSNLEILDVRDNSLVGVVSEIHFSKLTSLIELSLDRNSLTVNVGPSWVPPFQLQLIGFSSCNLGPAFPHWLKTQKNVSYLYMSNASISDSIPNWFENISSSVIELDLSHNQITKKLPKLRKLIASSSTGRFISLNSNKFEGPMICFPSDVITLDLSNNLISDLIPQSIGDMMPQLKFLALSNNQFNGSIPHSLCRMEFLVVLDLSNNQLSGRLPQCWEMLSPLLVMDLGNNNLSGHIPTSLSFLQSLWSLHLQNNRLQGKIPRSLKKLTNLVTLDLSGNSLTGFIPPWIGESLTSLRILSVHSNMFHAEVPLQLCGIDSLRILSLANNNLIGTIPPCFDNFTSMIDVGSNQIEDGFEFEFNFAIYDDNVLVSIKGLMREYTRTLQFLFSIDLSGNNFVGEIPEELTSLSRLQNLNLSGNSLEGHIPSQIGNLKWLESLDLSRNELSGLIPGSISSLNYLSHLNLSFNNLSGHIPTGNQLQTLDDKSIYIGNNGLCGPPLKSCPEDELPKRHVQVEERGNDELEIQWFYCGLGMGFSAGFVGACSSLYFIDSWRHSFFQLVDNIFNKLWVIFAIKANQLRRNFHGDK